MKEKRNCNNNSNYPIYPGFQNFNNPMMVPPMGFPNYQAFPNFNQGVNTNTIEQQINNLNEQITLLDQRLTRLEKQYINSSNYNKYSDSNYYMV